MIVNQMAKCVYYNELGLMLFEDPLISIQEILQIDNDLLTKVV